MEAVEKAIDENEILAAVQGRLLMQTLKGLEKYGETVNPASYSFIGWIEHLQQELTDAIVYLEVMKRKMNHET